VVLAKMNSRKSERGNFFFFDIEQGHAQVVPGEKN
jgi:hypothetical protein